MQVGSDGVQACASCHSSGGADNRSRNLNFANFWDGRANNTFNGATPFGRQDLNASVFALQSDGTLASQKVGLVNASLASQAVGPPSNPFEMSFGNPDVNKASR